MLARSNEFTLEKISPDLIAEIAFHLPLRDVVAFLRLNASMLNSQIQAILYNDLTMRSGLSLKTASTPQEYNSFALVGSLTV